MNLNQPVPVNDGHAERLTATNHAFLDAKEVLDKTAKARRRAVIEALDAGMPQKVVADLIGVGPSRIHAIVVSEASRP